MGHRQGRDDAKAPDHDGVRVEDPGESVPGDGERRQADQRRGHHDRRRQGGRCAGPAGVVLLADLQQVADGVDQAEIERESRQRREDGRREGDRQEFGSLAGPSSAGQQRRKGHQGQGRGPERQQRQAQGAEEVQRRRFGHAGQRGQEACHAGGMDQEDRQHRRGGPHGEEQAGAAVCPRVALAEVQGGQDEETGQGRERHGGPRRQRGGDHRDVEREENRQPAPATGRPHQTVGDEDIRRPVRHADEGAAEEQQGAAPVPQRRVDGGRCDAEKGRAGQHRG